MVQSHTELHLFRSLPTADLMTGLLDFSGDRNGPVGGREECGRGTRSSWVRRTPHPLGLAPFSEPVLPFFQCSYGVVFHKTLTNNYV